MIETVAVIMARGGSKGIPGKNGKLLNGVPLLVYTMDAAYNCDKIDLVVFTTDSDELLDLFKRYMSVYDPESSRTIAIRRPDYLGQDHVQVGEVVTHAVRQLEMKGISAKNLVVLQPTSPFRTYQHIYEAFNMWDGKSTLLSGIHVGGYYWSWDYLSGEVEPLGHDPTWRQGRQYDYRDRGVIKENGAVYLMPYENVSLWGNVRKPPFRFLWMREDESVDLDTPKDLELAEKQMVGWGNIIPCQLK